MKKLILDLEALTVESFETRAGAEGRGTVIGLTVTAAGETCVDAECAAEGDTALYTCASCQTGCTCVTCEYPCGEETGPDEPRRIILY